MSQFRSAKFENARENLKRGQREVEPYRVDVCGFRFLVHPRVFSPKYFRSTEIINSRFPFRKNEDFLEIGCGIGVTSILAGIRYENKVVAMDINPYAVEFARRNAELNHVSHLVDVRESDVFSAIKSSERFDTIYWDLPFVYVPPEYECRSWLERGVCDPGYRSTRLFLKQVSMYLKAGGRILVGFGSNGEFELFESMAKGLGYRIQEVIRESITEREGLTYMLLELIDGRDHENKRQRIT